MSGRKTFELFPANSHFLGCFNTYHTRRHIAVPRLNKAMRHIFSTTIFFGFSKKITYGINKSIEKLIKMGL